MANLETSDPDAVREAARNILSQPDYTAHELTLRRQIMYYIAHPWEAVSDASTLLLGLLLGGGAGALFAWIFVVVLIGGAVWLIFNLTRTTTRDNAVPVGLAPNTRYKTAAEFLAEADKAEAERRWRQAIRMRYSALLADLGSGGFVRLRPGRTTGEYLNEVRSNLPDAGDAFLSATRIFERAWYGTSETSDADLDHFKEAASGVKVKVAA